MLLEEYYHLVVVAIICLGVLVALVAEVEITEFVLSPLIAKEKKSTPTVLSKGRREIPKEMQTAWGRLKQRLTLFMLIRRLRKMASSERQVWYMLAKVLFDVKIDTGETEMDSYLDMKNSCGDNWPFMWEVKNVKDAMIDCAGSKCYPMSSYSYLDLMREPRVNEAGIKAARIWSSGNHGPRMLGGNMQIMRELEKVIGKFFGRNDSLLCAAGYLACMSAVSALVQKGDVIFADRRIHSSLLSGIKITEGASFFFPHNDYDSLRELVLQHRKSYRNAFLVIESVYSMDGDIANLPAAAAISREFDVDIILDEAHGLGVLGKTGRGLEEHYNMPGVCRIICGTFSKSIATIGGYIVGDDKLVSYLDFHAVGSLFSAPLPAYCVGCALESFKVMEEQPWRTQNAQDNSKYLRSILETGMNCWPEDYPENWKYELDGVSSTPVIPVIFPDDAKRLFHVTNSMKYKGFMLAAVAFPACPMRSPRFRVTATAALTVPLMESFVKALVQSCVDCPPTKLATLLGS